MSKIKVRLIKRGVVNVKLKPKNGIKAKTNTTYLYDPTLVEGWVDLAEDWARKTDGKVEEEGEQIDYSSKAWAIGGTGTETNNSKYYAEQAAISETNAGNSATSASGSASSASSSASLAKDWATKTDGTVDGNDYSAKYYAQQITPIASDITTVAGIASDVSTVSGISSNVTSVAGNATNINKVAGDINRVNLVADDIDSVHTVAVDISTVIDVADNKANIAAVAGNESNINAVAGNETNINAVASNETNINTVAGDSTNINAVANDLTNIDAVANDLANIDNASTYATNANIWAEGTDVQVQALGGIHSSKGWAQSLGTVYKPAGSVAFASLPALSQDILGNVYNITDDFTTTSDFVEGAGKSYSAGTNVVCVDVNSSYKWDILGSVVDLSRYVTTDTVQTITSAKKIFANDEVMAGNQASVFATISNSNSGNATWIGRYICGAKNLTFLMGTYNNMAGLGAHAWTNAQTGSGAAWADFYLNPDGNKTVYIGGNAWAKDKGWFKVQNSGSNTGGKVQVNIGSISSANWKDVAYNGENISDFNNDAGYTTNVGTVTSVNSTSPDGNGNVSLTIPSTASDVGALPDSTKYGADLSLTSGTLQLLDQDGNALGNSVTVPDASNFANTSLNNLDATGQGIIDGKVSKTGDTMTGTLEVDDADVFIKKTTFDSTTTTAPAEFTNLGTFGILDTNGAFTGYIQNSFRTDNVIRTQLNARRIIGGANKNASLNLDVDSSGNSSCTFPNTACVDGQWVTLTNGDVAADVSVNGSGNLSFDIATLLPNDKSTYEVLLSVIGTTGSTSGNCMAVYVYSDAFRSNGRYICAFRAQTRAASSVMGGGNIVIPVTSSRKVYLIRSTSYNGTVSIDMRAYRRIGTNS